MPEQESDLRLKNKYSVLQKKSENISSGHCIVLDQEVLGQGGETLVQRVFGYSEKSQRIRKSGPYAFKDYSIKKTWDQIIDENGNLLDEFLYDKRIESTQANKITLNYYRIFNKLREINREQKKDFPRFNLPKTVRLTKNQENDQLGLLISDLTQNGNFNLLDLKGLRVYDLIDLNINEENIRQAIKKIISTVEKDLDLAEKYNIKLGGLDLIYCCDVWTVGIKKNDPSQIEITINDLGWVKFNATKEELKLNRDYIENDLKKLKENFEYCFKKKF